jgi:hypothetical protein
MRWNMYLRVERCIPVLIGETGGKRRLGKDRCRWEDNIKMGLNDGWGTVGWIDVAVNRDGLS